MPQARPRARAAVFLREQARFRILCQHWGPGGNTTAHTHVAAARAASWTRPTFAAGQQSTIKAPVTHRDDREGPERKKAADLGGSGAAMSCARGRS